MKRIENSTHKRNGKRTMSRVKLALITVVCVPMMTLADPPSTPPSTQPASPLRGNAFTGRPDVPMPRVPHRDMNQPTSRPSQDDIDAAVAFVKEQFPNHYDFFNRLPERGPYRNKIVVPRMVQRYQQLLKLKDANPEAYDAMLRQAKYEDDALGYARDLWQGKPDADVRLREVARVMTEKSLAERRERIDRLRKSLDDLDKKLAADEQNKEQLIAQQVDRAKNEVEHLMKGSQRSDDPGNATPVDALPADAVK